MYIAIEGVIGVGKTTLARLLQPALEASVLFEVFEENPFLAKFYTDRQRYAFQTQIFFLLSRYHQQRRTVTEALAHGSLIADYTFEKDALFARINLEGDELEMYYRIHEALAEKIINPDLVVYLRASTPVLMERIAARDRSYERDMDVEYIDLLNHSYDDFFTCHHKGCPYITIETDNLNFVRNLDDLKQVENRIRQALKLIPFQAELPFPMDGQ